MKTITYVEDIALVTLKNCPSDVGFFAEVLEKTAKADVNVDMISQTPPSGGCVDFCFTVSDNDLPSLLSVTASVSKSYPAIKTSVNGNNCKVAIFDDDMAVTPGYAADIFKKAAVAGAEIRLITTSEKEISLLIVNGGLDALLENLNK